MLRKFVTIKNVGKFRNCCAAGDIEFRKLSLVYGENGRGKTTLGAVLRSLQAGDPNPVLERHTLNSRDPSYIRVLTDCGSLTFKDGVWDGTYPSLAIFDSHYVSQNVYSGDYVDLDHKKNLARIIVGEQGVTLAREVDRLDAEIRTANGQLKVEKAACEKHVPPGIKIEEFLSLAADPAIDTKIRQKRQETAAIENAATIQTKSGLATVSIPELPAGLDALLTKTLAGVSKDAEAQVRQQIESHQMGADGQAWLAQGLPFVHEEACPFCGQRVDGNDLVASYQAFFSESYRSFKDEIAAAGHACRDSLSDASMLRVQNTLSKNDTLAEFWTQYTPISLPPLSFDSDVLPVLTALRDAFAPYITKKLKAPLEAITPGSDVSLSKEQSKILTSKIVAYNKAVSVANVAIDDRKEATAAGDVRFVRRELLLLESQQKRHTSEAVAACDTYTVSTANKRALNEKKTLAKAALDRYTERVISNYEAAINKLLKRFAAGFRITGSRLQYVGGTTSSSFGLSINGVSVELGDAKTPPGTPCFRSTMSSGDRNTLALAFFLVQIRERRDVADLTIVFDDPFTSLDSFRTHATRDQILQLTELARQVIVMSHYAPFLQLVSKEFDQAQIRHLCIAREGKADSEIRPWDMHATLARGYDQDIATLAAFHHGEAKDLRAVVRCIRPILEGYIRQRHPTHFPSDKKQWLGDMLSSVRDAAEDHPIAEFTEHYEDLSSLNSYTKRYHHDDNTDLVDAGPIQDAELQGFVQTTLEFVGLL